MQRHLTPTAIETGDAVVGLDGFPTSVTSREREHLTNPVRSAATCLSPSSTIAFDPVM